MHEQKHWEKEREMKRIERDREILPREIWGRRFASSEREIEKETGERKREKRTTLGFFLSV